MPTWFLAPLHAPSAGLIRIGILSLGLILGLLAVWKTVRGMEKVLKMPDGPEFLDALQHFLSDKHNTRSAEMSRHELGFLSVRELAEEVMSGGFDQYFFNSAGNYADDALWCLHLIGAETTASILERAMAQFPAGKVPDLRHDRQAVMDTLLESVQEVWEALDQEFYASSDDLDTLLTAFVRANEREFR